jgi:hypothetical protein
MIIVEVRLSVGIVETETKVQTPTVTRPIQNSTAAWRRASPPAWSARPRRAWERQHKPQHATESPPCASVHFFASFFLLRSRSSGTTAPHCRRELRRARTRLPLRLASHHPAQSSTSTSRSLSTSSLCRKSPRWAALPTPCTTAPWPRRWPRRGQLNTAPLFLP